MPTFEEINGGSKAKAYDQTNDMLRVTSCQKKFRDSFGQAELGSKWGVQVAAGGSVTLAGGALVMGSGTTVNGVTSITGTDRFTIPFRASVAVTLSQRIVNQSFYIELVSVDPSTGLVDEKSILSWLFDSTSATTAKYVVSGFGNTPLVSADVTVSTTAGGSVFELEAFSDETWFHTAIVDSVAQRAASYRRQLNIPNPNSLYRMRLRWVNGATAPASNTTATVRFVTVQDYAELTAEITAGRGSTAAGQSISTFVAGGSVGVSGTVTTGTLPLQYTDSATALAASAVFTGTARDNGSTPTYQKFVARVFADQAGTLRVEHSTDNVTWRLAEAQVAVAAGVPATIQHLCTTRYVRVVYTNGATLQTAMLLTSAYHRI